MHRRRFLAGSGTAIVASLAGCSAVLGGQNQGDQDYDVGMSATAFLPESVEIAVGETVVWRNTGSRNHTVTAYDGKIPVEADYFASGDYENEGDAIDGWQGGYGGAIQSTETYEHTFDVPGQYIYYCIPHEAGGMIGTVTVREE